MNIVSDVIRKNTAIQIMLFIVILVVVYFGYRGISSAIKKAKEKADQKEDEKLLEELVPKGEKGTYSQIQYKSYADKLFAAMDGWGTDEDVIMSVFNEMNNTADVKSLIAAFGVKKEKNLNQWIVSELDTEDIDTINNILTVKDITFRF